VRKQNPQTRDFNRATTGKGREFRAGFLAFDAAAVFRRTAINCVMLARTMIVGERDARPKLAAEP